MSTITFKMAAIGLLLLITLISGIWLSKTGRPLNTMTFSIHKLTALIAVILTGLVVYSLFKNIEITRIVITMAIVTGLFFLTALISGGFLVFEKQRT